MREKEKKDMTETVDSNKLLEESLANPVITDDMSLETINTILDGMDDFAFEILEHENNLEEEAYL